MSQFIDEFCNDLANYNDNFLTLKEPKTMEKKVKWQLVEMERYDRTFYMLKKDSEYIKAFSDYEEAAKEFNMAVNFIEKDTVLMEITL